MKTTYEISKTRKDIRGYISRERNINLHKGVDETPKSNTAGGYDATYLKPILKISVVREGKPVNEQERRVDA